MALHSRAELELAMSDQDKKVSEKVETYDRSIEIAAAELAATPHSTPEQRAAFSIAVSTTATATADDLIRRALDD